MGRLPSPEPVPSWGLPSLDAFMPPSHPPAWLRTRSGRVHLQNVGFELHGSGKFFAELAGGGSLERGPRKPVSGAETMASSQMAEGGAWSLGCGGAYQPPALHSCGQVSEQSRDPR